MIRPPGRHFSSLTRANVSTIIFTSLTGNWNCATWAPFRLQFYMNGHNLLAHKLQKKEISYRMQDNAFLEISDVKTVRKLSDRINPKDLHKVPDTFARRYCPVPKTLGLGCTWTIRQIECATDIMFRQPCDMKPLYDEIIRTSVFTVKPDNIATFLGQRITYNCKKEIATKLSPPFKWGGLFTPPGTITGSAKGGISQHHYFRLPSYVGLATFFYPLTYHFLLVPEYIFVLFLHLHSLLSKHNIPLPKSVCLHICFGTQSVCQTTSVHFSLSSMT